MTDTSDTPTPDPAQTEPAKIITVTLNPSLDRTLTTLFLAPGHYNSATSPTRLDPAGRGVNISRALHGLGVPTHAVILLGRDANGRAYEALLSDEQCPLTILHHQGHTRSNMVIVDTGHNHETVIWDQGSTVTRDEQRAVRSTMTDLINRGDAVVFAGSLPDNARRDTYALLTSLAQTAGAAVAINAGGGDVLQLSLQARPLLTYLTQRQLEGLFNYPVRSDEEVLYTINQLRKRGVRRVLVGISDANRAYLVTEEGVWMAEWPEASGSQFGSAEALVAGYLAGRVNGRPFGHALKLGALMAAYTGTQVGHEFGQFDDLEAQIDRVNVTPCDVLDDRIVVPGQ